MYLYGAGEGHSILDVGLSSVSGASPCMRICTEMVFFPHKNALQSLMICLKIYVSRF